MRSAVARVVGAASLWTDPIRPHHLVIFVLDDVVVPDEAPRSVVGRFHPGDLTGVSDDGVLAGSGLPGLRDADDAARDLLPIDDLEQSNFLSDVPGHCRFAWK